MIEKIRFRPLCVIRRAQGSNPVWGFVLGTVLIFLRKIIFYRKAWRNINVAKWNSKSIDS